MARPQHQEQNPFDERVVEINRVSKKTKGGNRMSFTALMVVGDRKGSVGIGLGKAPDVLSAIKKGVRRAKKKMIPAPVDRDTIPFKIESKYGGARVMLKPAPTGTGVIAGGAVRSVVEAAGIQNIVGKIMGSSNQSNNVYATFQALKDINRVVKIKNIPIGRKSKTDLDNQPQAKKKSTSQAQSNKTSKQVNKSVKPQAKKPTTKNTKSTKQSTSKSKSAKKPTTAKGAKKTTKQTKKS